MKGYAMLKIGQTGWIEKEKPSCGPLDAIVRPIAIAPCTSDDQTEGAGAIGDRHNMILGHEAVGEVAEVGSLGKDCKRGATVIVAAITPDWNSLEAQGGCRPCCHRWRRLRYFCPGYPNAEARRADRQRQLSWRRRLCKTPTG